MMLYKLSRLVEKKYSRELDKVHDIFLVITFFAATVLIAPFLSFT